jgi:WD40 repeat protein
MQAHRLFAVAAIVVFSGSVARADGPAANSPDGTRVAVSDGKTVNVIETASGKILMKFVGSGNVTALAYSPDGKLLAAAAADDTVRVLDAAVGKEVIRIAKAPGGITGIAFSPDGKKLIASDKIKVLRRWNPATGEEVKE